jgi:serine/threonine protein kinase
MQTAKTTNTEPLPGYRLLEPLGSGGFGEVWKCEAPGGLFKAIKFVSGRTDHLAESGSRAEKELRALERVKTIRHPFLLAMDRVEVIDEDLLIVMELADRSLHGLLQVYRGQGQAGIPKAELVSYLREAAEALDVMNQEHRLLHLDIKPRNLFLVGQHVKVGDFGLVNSLSDLQADGHFGAITPLYAAPELFLGKITPFCDQYSLAITYHELLTGTLPFSGKSFRQLALQYVQGEPDLGPLPEADRPAVSRALSKEAGQRFPTCLAFVRALEAAPPAPPPARTPSTRHDICLGELEKTPEVSPNKVPPPPAPRPAAPAPADNFIPGHKPLERVGTLPVGEVWKALTARGEPRLVKLVPVPDLTDDPENDPLTLLRAVRHDRLMPLEVIGYGEGRVALVNHPGDGSLADRLKESQRTDLSGIPRGELLGHLRQAAEALDALQQRYSLRHLALNPRQLVLRDGGLRILDFGLAELLWLRAGFELAELNTRYATPELFSRQTSRASDQYSLALIYQELLTGVHPYRNLNQRQMAAARLRGNPDVGLLPAPDRPVVLRALQLDPDLRFPTCTDFVAALEAVSCEAGPRPLAHPTCTLAQTVCGPAGPPSGPPPAGRAFGLPPEDGRPMARPATPAPIDIRFVRQVVAEEVAAAAGKCEVRSTASLRYLLRRGDGRGACPCLLEARCFGRLLPGTVRLKLKGFQEQWRAERIAVGNPLPALAGPSLFVYYLRLPAPAWQRWLGMQPGLEVRVELKVPETTTESLTEVVVQIHPKDCKLEQGAEVLAAAGPLIVESLRKVLQLNTERRCEERFPYAGAVQVHPVLTNLEVAAPFVAQGKDISSRGLGLFLPCQPPSPCVYLQFAPGDRPAVAVPAHIVRAQPLPDGRVEAGLCYAWEGF